jgi:hypothetical protein
MVSLLKWKGNTKRVRSDAQPSPFSVSTLFRTTLEQVVGAGGIIDGCLFTLPHRGSDNP